MKSLDRIHILKIVERTYLLVDSLIPLLGGDENENPFRKYRYAVSGFDYRSRLGVIVPVDDYVDIHHVLRTLKSEGLATMRSFTIHTERESRLGLSRLSIAGLIRLADPKLYERIKRETFTHVIFELSRDDILHVSSCTIAGREVPLLVLDLEDVNLRVIARSNDWYMMRRYVDEYKIRERLIMGKPLPEVPILERRRRIKPRLYIEENSEEESQEHVSTLA
ncbi:MAG: hypothetical protein GXO26_09045 [Crenarchaeota archaeon]|nr:hypothetical protein [Thermoproteota archaeon]